MLMAKHLLLFILCLCTIAKANAQKKTWQTIAFSGHSKDKGVLKEVNDSSLVLLTKNGEKTLLYDDISRLKFIRKRNTAIKVIGGIVVGASVGATIGANKLSKGKSGEPATLSGVVGGIGGGFLGGLAGGFAAPLLCNLLFTRKIQIDHTPVLYPLLRQKLQPYIAK